MRKLTVVAMVVLLAACSKDKHESSISVPADCQQFLDRYFGAWKAKDVSTLQALSFYLSPEERSAFPEGSLELWRESKNKLVTENFHRVSSEFGDFRDYKLVSMKSTTVSAQNQPAANMMGAGVHTELVCKAKFSKKHEARIGLHLIKGTQSSQYIVASWNFQAAP